MKNLNVVIVDQDHSRLSEWLKQKVDASAYFVVNNSVASYREALACVRSNASDVVLQIPAGFDRKIKNGKSVTLFIAADAINGVRANLGVAYLLKILESFHKDIAVKSLQREPDLIRLETIYRYNPYLQYPLFMSTGVLAILLTMVGSSMSALNIVREKETGTIEQINVTPIKKHIFILGKLIPFWIMGMMLFSLGLIVIHLIYGVVVQGSIALLLLYAALYLTAILGIGLLNSALSQTQQQAMLISFFFMLIFIFLSGLYTPIESMPQVLQKITFLNPSRYFIEVIRMVVIKGSGWREVRLHFVVTAVFAIIFNSLAIYHYKKQI